MHTRGACSGTTGLIARTPAGQKTLIVHGPDEGTETGDRRRGQRSKDKATRRGRRLASPVGFTQGEIVKIRCNVLVAYLSTHLNVAFSAADLRHRTGVPKKFVGRATALDPAVRRLTVGRKIHYVMLG